MRDLLRLGMDIARLNFSHGTHEDHAHNIQRLRRAAEREGRTLCILQDLQGPKIRTGPLEGHKPVLLKTGSVVTITPQNVPGTGHAHLDDIPRPRARTHSRRPHSAQ